MWKLGHKPHNSFYENICFEFLVLCLFSVLIRMTFQPLLMRVTLMIFCIYLLLLDSGVLTADGNPVASVFFDVASKITLNFFFYFLLAM